MTLQPLYETKIDQLLATVYASNEEIGQAASREAAETISRAIRERGVANVILATGNSQLTFLNALRQEKSIEWSKVNVFHMDEYIGIDPTHPASFPNFMRKHLLAYVKPKMFYPVDGQRKEIETVCSEYAQLLRKYPADLCALGYGENGHLAFNDPPYADFDDPVWVKTIKLALASRQQQVGEGHFAKLEECPTHAISLTIPALLAAKRVLAIVPEARKAAAVERALHGPISVECPGSVLRRTPHAHLFLEPASAGNTFPVATTR